MPDATLASSPSRAFERLGGYAAILAAIGGLLYSVGFTSVVQKRRTSAPELGAFLLVGGLLIVIVLLALHQRVRVADPTFAALALVLGVAGALGSALHGAYDLANAVHPPAVPPGADIPSAVDPRGVATFGLSGLALVIFAWLIVRSGKLPRALGYLGYVLGVLLVVIYLGRLFVYNPAPLLIPAALTGLIINPVWYIWLGVCLLRDGSKT